MGIDMDDSNVEDFKEVEKLKEILDKQYADFIILGYDHNDEFALCVNVGVENESSLSNRNRINGMIGQIEIMKYYIIPNVESLISKRDHEFFIFFQEEALTFFADYAVIAVDIFGNVHTNINVNKNKKARFLGELEETKIQLIVGLMGFINPDNQNNSEDNEDSW